MLEVRDLHKAYPIRGGGRVHAVRGVSFEVPTGSTLGVVGESGCGKSTMARMLVGLETPTGGAVLVDGAPYSTGRRPDRRARRRVQMVFQDPHSSLNERFTVGATLREVLAVHKLVPKARRPDRVRELLGQVGLAASTADRYPHELSGGQRQRVGIARALAVDPRILVLDEPVSALDVSVRAEVMNLLIRLRDELALTYVFISHDLSMVRHISDRIAVMYLGRIVELGPWLAVSDRPRHPYTQALHDAVPVADPSAAQGREFDEIRGELPDPAHPPPGCPFHTRCPLVKDACARTDQVLAPVAADHGVACMVVTGQPPEETR
ncbi:MAG: ABC transporter ATP-binding protein [Sporichthyaceae bacterium]|nr:ABC transporter ATP-binding protein [Sporichthyaceae bacterium]